ncbi:MAG: 50S ribosomal protein L6 [Candidatus Micrarchaeota archaeon]
MEIKIPEGCKVLVGAEEIVITTNGEDQRIPFTAKKIRIEMKGNDTLDISSIRKVRRETNSMMWSISKHILNAFASQLEPYQKKLQVIYAHFPVSIEVKGQKVNIKNFLGEKVPREADIVGKTQVSVSGQDITVTGNSKEAVGQTAANIVQSVRITGKDRRVFQDGIYLMS